MTMPAQRLIVLYDGTWNEPHDRTNVYRLTRSIRDRDEHGVVQKFFYDPGVGTGRIDRFRGGVFGYGLKKNLLQGYDWLARQHLEGSEIYIFGFSRGAYTARSLAGLIRKCGVLHVSTPGLLEEAEQLYRNKPLHPDDRPCRHFRDNYSHQVDIHLVGVWDTVGTLGIPGTMISEKGRYSWHDTTLSKIALRAYQALALDEHRAAYDAVLWTSADGLGKEGQLEVEQRWFSGAHANVGGGYRRPDGSGYDPFAALSYCWMHDKAVAAGLRLDPCTPPEAVEFLGERPRDSYAEFLHGAYRLFSRYRRPGDGRQYRAFDRGISGQQAVGVTVDPSVWQRWQNDPGYRPPTLLRAGLQPPP